MEDLNKRVEDTLLQLEQRLPDLVMAATEVLPSIAIDAEAVKTIVTSMINEFSKDDEKLDVYLCKSDLDLLKGLSRNKDPEIQNDSDDGGFASAIAGIFEGLDGDESLLDGYPN